MERNELMKALEAIKTLTIEFKKDQLDIIYDGIESNLSPEQIILYANPRLSSYQMEEIKRGLVHGLKKSQIEMIANPYISSYQMKEYCDAFLSDIPEEYIIRYINPYINYHEVKKINEAIRKYDPEYIKFVFDPSHDVYDICRLCCMDWNYLNFLENKKKKRLENADNTIQNVLKLLASENGINGEIKYSFNIKTGILKIEILKDNGNNLYKIRRNFNSNYIDGMKSHIPELKKVKINTWEDENSQIKYKETQYSDDPFIYEKKAFDERYKCYADEFKILGDMRFTQNEFKEFTKYNDIMKKSKTRDILESYFEENEECLDSVDLDLCISGECEDPEYLDGIFKDLKWIYKGLK